MYMQTKEEFDADNYEGDTSEITKTIVIITERLDDGDLIIDKRVIAERLYTSDFWKSQPDGEYELHMNQGGIRYLDMPSEEKESFGKFILPYLYTGRAFNGVAIIENENGRISQVRIEPRI